MEPILTKYFLNLLIFLNVFLMLSWLLERYFGKKVINLLFFLEVCLPFILIYYIVTVESDVLKVIFLAQLTLFLYFFIRLVKNKL